MDQRPNLGSRPSIGDRPALGDRPNIGERPGVRPGGGGAAAQLPANANRPGGGAGIQRPGIADRGQGFLPGLNNGVAGGRFPGNRGPLGTQDRRDDLQSRLNNRDDRRGDLTDRRENRRDDVGDRRDDLTNRRDDRRDDYAGNRDERREDWQSNWNNNNWNNNNWAYNNWHNGSWNNFHGGGGYWGHVWDNYPAAAAIGLTGWGVNQMANTFGYWGYTNPYYVASETPSTTYVDYSQPLVVYESPTTVVAGEPQSTVPPEGAAAPPDAAAPGQPLPPGVTEEGLANFDQARQEFYKGQYDAAMESTSKALETMSKDATLNEFRGLVLFAQGNYQEAAAALYAVLTVGPGWDWTTMSTMYPSLDVYTQQLRKLEEYTGAHPDVPYPRFLLAYHYITMGHNDVAKTQLEELVKLTPDDRLAKELLVMVGGELPAANVAAAPKPPAAGPAIEESSLVGGWQASSQGAQFSMDLGEDGRFTWAFTRDGREEKVSGVYVLNGSTLAMEPDTGGTMLADIRLAEKSGLNFQLIGAPPGDPGLKFSRKG